jgi:hypothetical protein
MVTGDVLTDGLSDGRATTCRANSSSRVGYRVLALGLGEGTALLILALAPKT